MINIQIYQSDVKQHQNILKGIFSYGFEKPSAIQQKAIVKVAEGHDVIAQAQSGSGKTAAFLIGSLKNINYEGWLVVEAEQDPAKANPLEYAKIGHSYLTNACKDTGLSIIL